MARFLSSPAQRNFIFTLLLLCFLAILLTCFALVTQIDWLHGISLRHQLPLAEYLGRLAPLQLIGDLAWAVVGIALFAFSCTCAGIVVVQGWLRAKGDALAVLATAFVVGEIIYSIVFLSAIVLWGLHPYLVAVVLLLGILLGLRPAWSWLVELRRHGHLTGLERSDKVVLRLLVAALLVALIYSTDILGYDAVVEYFSHAKIMAMTGRPIYSFAKDFFPVSSFHSTILYTAAIELFADQSARLISWLNGMVLVLLSAAIGGELGLTPRARLYAAAMILSTTAFVDVLGDGKIDLLCTAPIMAAVYWMVRTRREPTGRSFALIGFLLGFAMIARAYNVFLAPAFALCFYVLQAIALHRQGEFSAARFMRAAVWAAVPMAALGAFHLWQNAVWLGNALAPVQVVLHLGSSPRQGELDAQKLLVYRLLYPIVLSTVGTAQSAGVISPLFLGVLPLALRRSFRNDLRSRPALVTTTLATLATLLLWIWGYSAVVEIRYVFFLWLLLFLPVAQLMDRMSRQGAAISRHLVTAPVILLLLYMSGRAADIGLVAYAPVDRLGQPHCFDIQAACAGLDHLSQVAAPGSRVFIVNAYRYYLRPDLFACSSEAQEYTVGERLAQLNSSDFWTYLYKAGFRYITYDTYYAMDHADFGRLPSLAGAPPWLRVSQLSSTSDGYYRIYEIHAVNPPYQPDSSCSKDSTGAWQVEWKATDTTTQLFPPKP